MDKLQYKDMLADAISDLTDAENEITRLQILVVTYQDKENKIKRLVYDNPNDFGLGGKIRCMFREENE